MATRTRRSRTRSPRHRSFVPASAGQRSRGGKTHQHCREKHPRRPEDVVLRELARRDALFLRRVDPPKAVRPAPKRRTCRGRRIGRCEQPQPRPGAVPVSPPSELMTTETSSPETAFRRGSSYGSLTMSTATKRAEDPGNVRSMSAHAAESSARRRATSTTFIPRLAHDRANASPMPSDAPAPKRGTIGHVSRDTHTHTHTHTRTRSHR
jgi:hypothetical protein